MGNEKKRKSFSAEFKAEAIKMLEGRRMAEVARNLGVSLSALHRWRSEVQPQVVESTSTEDLAAKCKRLESENRRLRLEQEILKKATAYFAKELV